MGGYRRQYQDHSDEYSSANVRMPDLTAANFAVQDGLMDDLAVAFDAITIGTPSKDTRVAAELDLAGILPGAFAQRETKWLVRCSDDVNGRPVNFEVPTADLDLLETGTDRMDSSGAEYIALVAAIEALPVQSIDGNAVTVLEVIFVGRNL